MDPLVVGGSFIGGVVADALFGHPIKAAIAEWLRPRSELVVNVTEVYPLKSGQRLEDLFVLFQTANKHGLWAAMHAGNMRVNNAFGADRIPDRLVAPPGGTDYTVSVKNIGEAPAINVGLRFEAMSPLHVAERDAEMTVREGGTQNDPHCYIEIARLEPNEQRGFMMVSEGPGVRNVVPRMDRDGDKVSVNFRWYRIAFHEPGMTVGLDGIEIGPPPANPHSTPITYYWNTKAKEWRPFSEGVAEE